MNSKSRAASLSLLISGLAICMFPSLSSGADAKATPESVYNKYHQAMVNAKTFEDVTPFLTAKGVKEMKDTPAEERTMMFSFIKDTCPKDVHVVSSKVEGEKANLKLIVGDGKPVFMDRPLVGKTKEETKGEVSMVIENGEWKIDKESWKTSSVSADETPPPADMPKGK
jgi:hypothetical protein